MKRMLQFLGGIVIRLKWVLLGLWIVAFVALIVLRQQYGGDYTNNYSVPGSQATVGANVLAGQYPQLSGNAGQIVFHTGKGDLEPYKDVINMSVQNFAKLPHVVYANTPFAAPNSPFVSKNGTTAYANMSLDVVPTTLDQSYLDRMNEAVTPARQSGLQVEFGGSAGQVASTTNDLTSEAIGLGAALVLLIIMFVSIVAAAVPLVSAVFSVIIGLSILGLLAARYQLPTSAPTIATLLGLGVAVDYGLFMVARYRELREGLMTHESAVSRMEQTSGNAIIVAGGTVVVAILGLYVSGVPFVGAMGAAAALVVAVAVLAAITLTPAMISIARNTLLPHSARHVYTNTQAELEEGHDPYAKHENSWFARLGRAVSWHPWPWALIATAVMAVLAIPLFSIRMGQVDAGTNPEDQTSRRAYDLLEQNFGPGVNGPLTVVVELPQESQQATQDLLGTVTTALKSTSGVASVLPASVNQAKTVAVVTAIPTTSPQDEATTDLVNRLRDDVLPGIPAKTYVTGTTAGNVDFTEQVAERLPWLIGAVILLSLLLLMMSFRSIWIPIKAAFMNILSVGAAYGIIVAIFQWGWGSSLLGVHESVPIPAYVPMLIFAIVFGLSMDYEVFLLSRMHESYKQTGDAHRAVALGIGSTGRTITTAAAIMVVVFSSFVLSDDVAIKMLAVGMAFSVLLDSTIVRMALVPAIMSILDRHAWWMPRWLDRMLPNLAVEE